MVEKLFVGTDDRLLVQRQQNGQLLGDQQNAVVHLRERQLVVGQLQLAAQHVVVGDKPLALHLPDVDQPPFRLPDLVGQQLLLL